MTRRPALNVLHAITTRHWAILPETLETIARIALRENMDPAAVAAELGRPLDNTRTVTVRDRVATIPVVGPMFRYADFFTEVSGAVTYEEIAQDITTALRDGSIEAIILAIDSPGGEVTGIAELASLVRAARGAKPIIAMATDTAASAGYWLASAADEVVTSPTGVLGSIGVRAAFVDTTRRDEARGISTIDIVSSQSPKKAVDPTTDQGRAQIVATLDALAEVFIQAVADNRGVSRETVLSDFGQGDVLVGQAAVDAGLADRIATYESLHAELSATAAQRSFPGALFTASGRMAEENIMATRQNDAGSAASAATEPGAGTAPAAGAAPAAPTATTVTPAAFAADHPEAVAAWRAEGATAERQRLADIDALATAGHEQLVAAAKADPKATADTLARQILMAEKGTRKSALAAIEGDEKDVAKVAPMEGAAQGDSPTADVTRILTLHRSQTSARRQA